MRKRSPASLGMRHMACDIIDHTQPRRLRAECIDSCPQMGITRYTKHMAVGGVGAGPYT